METHGAAWRQAVVEWGFLLSTEDCNEEYGD